MPKYTATITVEIIDPDSENMNVKLSNDCDTETHNLLLGCVSSGMQAIHGELSALATEHKAVAKEKGY